jgi:hypothetical protein
LTTDGHIEVILVLTSQKGNAMSNETMLFCNGCIFLSPQEEDQKTGERHICDHLKIVLLHKGQHPLIPMPHGKCFYYQK